MIYGNIKMWGITKKSGSQKLFDFNAYFTYPKPINYTSTDTLHDKTQSSRLFSGSATTAHAVMDLTEDGGNRKYIMVNFQKRQKKNQRPIRLAIKTCEIGKKERKRAGKKIKEDYLIVI